MGEDPLNDDRVLDRGDELHPPGSNIPSGGSRFGTWFEGAHWNDHYVRFASAIAGES
jgi:hypothetical protein